MKVRQVVANILARPEKNGVGQQGGIRFGVSWALMIALTLLLVCAVGWAFFMGLMVGRGQNPQASIQAMAGMGKNSSRDQAVVAATDPKPLDEPEPEPKDNNPQPAAPKAALPTPAPGIARQAEKPAPVQTVAPRPAPGPKPRADSGKRYDYTFQTAAFKKEADAKKTEAALNKAGLKVSIRKSGKVYLTIVSLRGGEAEVDAMQKKLAKLKLGQPLQLSRKEIQARRRK